MGSIQRIDRPKPWRARYWGADGHQHSRSFKRKVDAERWLRDQEGKLDRGAWIDPTAGKVPLREYAENWLAGRSLKPKTSEGYRSLLNSRILPTFGDVSLSKVSRDDVRKWVAGMVAEGLSASRVEQCRSLLASIFKQAVEDGLVGRNPVLGVVTPRKKPRRQRFLTPVEVEGLARACERRQQGAGGLVRFLAWSGLRWGEAVALRWDCVDLERRRVNVQRSATEVRGELIEGEPKTHEHRTVIVPRHALPAAPVGVANSDPTRGGETREDPEDVREGAPASIRERERGEPTAALVFTAPRGGPLRNGNFRKKVWLPSVAESGLGDLVVHDLRDTAASLAISSGASIKAVQRMLGHASAAMTLDVYGDLYDEDLEELADRLEALHDLHRDTGVTQDLDAEVIDLPRSKR